MTDKKTPTQIMIEKAEEAKLKERQEAIIKIQKILEDNGLMFVIEQQVKVVPKQ